MTASLLSKSFSSYPGLAESTGVLTDHTCQKAATTSYPFQSYDEESFTDSFDPCDQSGVGSSTNTCYRHNGQHQSDHEMEDAFVKIRWTLGLHLYGVFDGHDGRQAVDYAREKIAAELYLRDLQPDGELSDEQIQEIIRNAFQAVEAGYFAYIDHDLARRTVLLQDINIGRFPNQSDALQYYPAEIHKLHEINQKVASGVSAAVALLRNGRLFVANVGDCRALLVKTDTEGCLRVVQLSIQHDISNSDECLRLSQLGLPQDDIRHFGHTTRCIGDFPRKAGFKEHDRYRKAHDEPVIAEPDLHPAIPIDEHAKFLILCTAGLYSAIEDAFVDVINVNQRLAQMVAGAFEVESTIGGVAQSVVDMIARHHYEAFNRNGERHFMCTKREDLTLLIRNFNYPLRGSEQPDIWGMATINTNNNNQDAFSTNSSINTISHPSLPLDKDGRIEPYVDFGDFYKAMEEYAKPATGKQEPQEPRLSKD